MKKKNTYALGNDQADAALQNIFAACEQAPNTVKLSSLMIRQKLNTRPYNIMIRITTSILIFTFLAPLLIVPFIHAQKAVGQESATTLVSYRVENDVLTIVLSGEGLHVDQGYLITEDDIEEYPLSFNLETDTVSFPCHEGTSNIYIPRDDRAPLHMLLSPH